MQLICQVFCCNRGSGIAGVRSGYQQSGRAVSWFGKLPGDIRIQGEKGGVFIPLTSMIIVSVVLTIVVNFLRRL